MDATLLEPADGDVVVVRASRAPDGQLRLTGPKRYGVIEWGVFELVSEAMASLSKEDAVLEARHCAADRGRQAWDSTGSQMVRLPRLPLVYQAGADTYAVSLDVTDYSRAQATIAWKSATYLNEADAVSLIVKDGVSLTMAKALVGKAPMPPACTGASEQSTPMAG
jgi:hypothetical protein